MILIYYPCTALANTPAVDWRFRTISYNSVFHIDLVCSVIARTYDDLSLLNALLLFFLYSGNPLVCPQSTIV